jgi:flagellar hook assembly protein FlgD
VEIRVYTVSGEVVRDLEPYPALAGNQEEFWDGKNRSGLPVSSGVFIYRILATSPRGEQIGAFGKCAAIR